MTAGPSGSSGGVLLDFLRDGGPEGWAGGEGVCGGGPGRLLGGAQRGPGLAAEVFGEEIGGDFEAQGFAKGGEDVGGGGAGVESELGVQALVGQAFEGWAVWAGGGDAVQDTSQTGAAGVFRWFGRGFGGDVAGGGDAGFEHHGLSGGVGEFEEEGGGGRVWA